MATLIALILLIVLACIQEASCDLPAENVTIEGYPRPKNFPDAPTVAYGKYPGTHDRSGKYGNCEWYGWANQNSPADLAAECLPHVYKRYIITLLVLYNYRFLPNAYDYYYCRPPSNNSTSRPDPVCYDYATQDIVCTIGCFNLSKTGLRLPPVTKPGESAGTLNGTTSDGPVARFQQVPSVLSLLASAVFSLLAGAG